MNHRESDNSRELTLGRASLESFELICMFRHDDLCRERLMMRLTCRSNDTFSSWLRTAPGSRLYMGALNPMNVFEQQQQLSLTQGLLPSQLFYGACRNCC